MYIDVTSPEFKFFLRERVLTNNVYVKKIRRLYAYEFCYYTVRMHQTYIVIVSETRSP